MTNPIEEISIVVRFAGDSGDGIQLLGSQFAEFDRHRGVGFFDLSGLPGGDPGARRHDLRRLGLPDQSGLAPHRDGRRRAGRSRRVQSGRAQSEPAADAEGRRDHPQYGRVQRAQFRQGGDQAGSAHDGRTRRLSRYRNSDQGADARSGEAVGPQQARRRAVQEYLGARRRPLDVRPRPEADRGVDQPQIRGQARRPRRQSDGVQRRARLRRDGGAFRRDPAISCRRRRR